MTQEIFLLNSFFSYFFNLGDYIKVFFAFALFLVIILGFVKWFIRNA